MFTDHKNLTTLYLNNLHFNSYKCKARAKKLLLLDVSHSFSKFIERAMNVKRTILPTTALAMYTYFGQKLAMKGYCVFPILIFAF